MCVCVVCVFRSLSEGDGEGGGGAADKREVRESDSPPVELREEDRREIFAARQKLGKTYSSLYCVV